MDYKVKKEGLTLYTKDKYLEEDIVIAIDVPRYDGSYIINTGEEEIVLPDGYELLNYIESTGTQYIDTEYNMLVDDEIEISLEVTNYNTSAKMGFLGSYESNMIYQLYASGTNNQTFYTSFGGKSYIGTTQFVKNYMYNISMNRNSIIINDNVYEYTTENRTNATKPLYLFWRNNTGAMADMKLYRCKIYSNDNLVRNFVPSKRVSDNAIGLYDLANNIFYENKGTGSFIGG